MFRACPIPGEGTRREVTIITGDAVLGPSADGCEPADVALVHNGSSGPSAPGASYQAARNREILGLWASGSTRQAVGERYGLSRARVQQIVEDAASPWTAMACWEAVLSVVDQLGDPPAYERYLELSEGLDDLPPAQIVAGRLGGWSHIDAALRGRAAVAAAPHGHARSQQQKAALESACCDSECGE